MINKPPLFKDLNIRIPVIIPIMGKGFINHGFGLYSSVGTLIDVPCGKVMREFSAPLTSVEGVGIEISFEKSHEL